MGTGTICFLTFAPRIWNLQLHKEALVIGKSVQKLVEMQIKLLMQFLLLYPVTGIRKLTRNSLLLNRPQMFDWIKVRHMCRPIQYLYRIGVKPIWHNLDCILSNIRVQHTLPMALNSKTLVLLPKLNFFVKMLYIFLLLPLSRYE